MRYLGCILLASTVATQSAAQTPTQDAFGVPDGWLTSMPYGFDVTVDSPNLIAWVNVAPVGGRDDYGILATDLYSATGQYRTVWIRGYHARNPDVKYRETKAKYQFDCTRMELTQLYRVAYRPDRQVLFTEAYPSRTEPVVPGSLGSAWIKLVCR